MIRAFVFQDTVPLLTLTLAETFELVTDVARKVEFTYEVNRYLDEKLYLRYHKFTLQVK